MISRRYLLTGAACVTLSACSSKFKSYDGPEVTRIVVYKERRKMYLLHHAEVLKDYPIDLGFAPTGPKRIEGDGKTPEGRYFIDRRNPNSTFHLSLGISYPNAADVARAKALGEPPGGDIFIHGQRLPTSPKGDDWTLGCISVKNRQMEDIYAMVEDGTVIDILP